MTTLPLDFEADLRTAPETGSWTVFEGPEA